MLSGSIRQLEYALAVAKHGSVSHAANSIHVSQPALSVAINILEEQLGQPLFVRRKGNPLSLTAFGRTFMQQAAKLVTDFDELTNQKQPMALGTLTIGCFEDLAPILAGQLLKALQQQYPDLQVELKQGSFEHLTTELADSSIDLAISYNLGLGNQFDSQVLALIQPHVLLPSDHPLTAKDQLTINDIHACPLVLVDQPHSIQHMVKLFRQQQMEPNISHRVSQYEVMRSLVAHGMGLGLSYTRAQGNLAYDGQPLVTRPLINSGAEPVVLASNRHNPVDAYLEAVAIISKQVLQQTQLSKES